MSRCGPFLPASTRRTTSALAAASPRAAPRATPAPARGRPGPRCSDGSRRRHRRRGRWRGPWSSNSSRPSAPWTTMARWRPVGHQDTEHLLRHGGIAHTDDLQSRPGRVGQRPEEVEDRGHAELAAHGDGEAHGGMKARREAEPDARLLDAAGHTDGPEVDDDTERLEDVGRPGRRRRGAAPVLAHPRPRAGHHQGGDGRHVDRPAAVTTGPARVDDVLGVVARAAARRGPAWPAPGRSSPRPSRP